MHRIYKICADYETCNASIGTITTTNDQLSPMHEFEYVGVVQVLQSFGSSSQLNIGKFQPALAAAAELEAALVEHVYSSPQTALGHLQAAGNALGMHTIVEGW